MAKTKQEKKDKPLLEKKLVIQAPLGFPTDIYFAAVNHLQGKGYTVKKVEDWLEINPRSSYHQEMMSKKSAIDQQIGVIMPQISNMKRDIELIRHDLRRLEEVQSHFQEKDEHVLKSDFVDLVDRHNENLSLINMAIRGTFPSIVVDFYKITKEEDIEKLDVSKSEKGVLKKKWRLYEYWKNRYGREIEDKVKMLRQQMHSRMASLESYKAQLEPYVRALHKVRVSETGFKDFSNPALVEGYSTSLAGVTLVAWKETGPKKWDVEKDKFTSEWASFMEIKIRKTTVVQKGREVEIIEIEMSSSLKTNEDVAKKEEEIKLKEQEIWDWIEQFRGDKLIGDRRLSKEDEEEIKELEGEIKKIKDGKLKKAKAGVAKAKDEDDRKDAKSKAEEIEEEIKDISSEIDAIKAGTRQESDWEKLAKKIKGYLKKGEGPVRKWSGTTKGPYLVSSEKDEIEGKIKEETMGLYEALKNIYGGHLQ